MSVLSMLALAACGGDKISEQSATLYVFGTKVDITLRDTDAATLSAVTTRLERDFQHMHKDWHAWKPGELVDLNTAFAAGKSKTVTPFLRPLIVQAQELYTLSDGLFNPAIGAIIGAWGFHADEKPQGGLPDFVAIRAMAAQQPSMDDVHIDGDQVSSDNPLVQLDFGGFAKGVALDRAEQVLRSMGIENALVNAGGDINTLSDNQPWTIGIRDPKAWGVIATVVLAPGEDIYTSGNYERFREADGIRYAHIIDPRTGMPVEHTVSASVIHENGALADAAATALIVAGPKHWAEVAQAMGVEYAMLVDKQGTVYASPEMLARITFETDKKLTIVQSHPLSGKAVELSQSRQSESPSIR